MSHTTAELREKLHRRRTQAAEQPASGELLIGKDILELLSSAMYVDPLTIYREYVQNAADSIDQAYEEGTLRGVGAGKVSISLDAFNREVRIRDNGIGLPREAALRVLTAFGASSKRGTRARGFRGVGRLAALGYAQTLVFRCKARAEDLITEIRWDCRKLKAILLDPTYEGDLQKVVADVVSVASVEGAAQGDHFFEVVLEKVLRIRNDVLLNEQAVSRYLRQVAPLPFSGDFPYREAIEKHLQPAVPPSRLRVVINDGTENLTRPYRAEFEAGKDKLDQFTGLELLEVRSADGELHAIGWMLNHSYLGAIPSAPLVRGLRARVGDIQIGDDDIFAEVFPEARFSSWAVGELHVLDPRIVPNGRRDNFEQNSAYHQLLSQLAPLGREVARKCRVSSAVRNRVKRFELAGNKVEQLLGKLEQGVLTRSAEAALRREAGGLLAAMAKEIGGELIQEEERRPLARRLERLRKQLEIAKSSVIAAEPLRGVPAKKRAVYEEVISLIYECAGNQVAAKALVDRIVARLATVKASS